MLAVTVLGVIMASPFSDRTVTGPALSPSVDVTESVGLMSTVMSRSATKTSGLPLISYREDMSLTLDTDWLLERTRVPPETRPLSRGPTLLPLGVAST